MEHVSGSPERGAPQQGPGIPQQPRHIQSRRQQAAEEDPVRRTAGSPAVDLGPEQGRRLSALGCSSGLVAHQRHYTVRTIAAQPAAPVAGMALHGAQSCIFPRVAHLSMTTGDGQTINDAISMHMRSQC